MDITSYVTHKDWLFFLAGLPALCLLIFYYLGRRGHYKLKDYTYSVGLLLAFIADIIFEIKTITFTIISLCFFILSYSFFIATIRREAVFTSSLKELGKIMLNMLFIISPILLAFSKIPPDYFFVSIIYMVFLALFYTTALLRKTNKSSYIWVLAGVLSFCLLTVTEVYFKFIIKVPYDQIINKVIYGFAHYATFMGITKSYKHFYVPTEK
ncbi:lysoplasmalogenase family protein [Emticicia sp. 17c]|uniref:lysoplasmalogenase family protein n=1 Tax=Emticicia sp. 17c TaxID=3127704 RepID=UPI00301D50E4